MKKVLQKVRFCILDIYYAVKDKRWTRKMRRKYPDFKGETEYDDGLQKFIWGVKSRDDLCSEPACLHTMNDIDLIYLREKKLYALSIETAYWFENSAGVAEYLKALLKCFTRFMDEQGYDKNDKYRFWMSPSSLSFEGETISEVYTNFRIFVEGYQLVEGAAEKQL